MEFTCIHCESQFAISASQFGTSGRCPHCRELVHIPAADEAHKQRREEGLAAPSGWLGSSISGLVSLVFHMLLVLVLAYCSWELGSEGIGEEVLIGTLPTQSLDETQEDELKSEEVARDETEQIEEMVHPPSPDDSSELSTDDFRFTPTSPSGGDGGAFDLGTVSIGQGGGGTWDGMIRDLRRHGLDIVIAFDSTDSMGGEIRQVKAQIESIGNTLVTLVPKARISICTYRDAGDEYVVKGLPLTGDIRQVSDYLVDIRAGGGADHPEAVQEGLRWAVESNDFRPRARKVILLFGDAPPHPQDKTTCLRIASDFNRQHKGVVSTVTCHSPRRLPDFVEIAEVGGGESFLTSDRRQIMTQLMVLVFGSKYRGKVVEAFRLMGE